MEKFGEINLNTLLGTRSLPSFSLASLPICSQVLSSHFSSGSWGCDGSGSGSDSGSGLGPFRGWDCSETVLGWSCRWARIELSLELGWSWGWGCNWVGAGAGAGAGAEPADSHSELCVEGSRSHCDVIQELHSYRMISEALGTQLAEITDRVLSHWLPTSQSEAELGRGGGRERERGERGSGVCVHGQAGGIAPPTPAGPSEPE